MAAGDVKKVATIDLGDLKWIDTLNYYNYNEEGKKMFFSGPESSILVKKGAASFLPPPMSTEDFVKSMDVGGYEKAFLAAFKMGSYRCREINIDYKNEKINEVVQKYPKRIVGICGYDPMFIMESIRDIEKAVKEWGFKGVYAHTYGWNVRANDRRMYPVYAKCVELDIPFSMQIGHSFEPLPSDCGRPLYVDEVAIDFPELRFVCSHTGYPWVTECVALAWVRENVFIDTSAHAPKSLPGLMQPLINFMDSSLGRTKVIHGTNGWPFKMIRDQFSALPLKPESIKAICRDNAIRVYKL
jgi:predicted TIM-barrel fold metal-dependent hydrolase